jgi:hypothetical protein
MGVPRHHLPIQTGKPQGAREASMKVWLLFVRYTVCLLVGHVDSMGACSRCGLGAE